LFINSFLYLTHLLLSSPTQAGLSKLNEATSLVDNLKQRAAEQGALLVQKQSEADNALKEITQAMQVGRHVLCQFPVIFCIFPCFVFCFALSLRKFVGRQYSEE